MSTRTDMIPPRMTDLDARPITRRELLRNRHCRHTVILERAQHQTATSTGRNIYGDSSYDAPVSYRALIMARVQSVTTADGDDVVSSVQILLETPPPVISTEDRITLPDGRQPQILAIAADASPHIHPTIIYT